ncbi:MAG: phosphoribosylformylglycinamidine synthase I [Candidatus Omnitrophica bacterium]|nr:phosphoribosylformylglycinamidine synthase I [Candidatus Omnitrophota bacterium]
MKNVKTLVLRTAGTNCDMETSEAFKLAGSVSERIHINQILKNPSVLKKYHILAIPGGFTYGDDIASGKILANELNSNLKDQLQKFTADGKLIIGICNGFQVLAKMGLLPNTTKSKDSSMEATLSRNDSGKFEDRWVYLKRDTSSSCIWTANLPEVIHIPVAHAEGKFITKNSALLSKLSKQGQIVFRYSTRSGEEPGYPFNPNGSDDNIAGISDTTGLILGMMPHPERHMFPTQHPSWQRSISGNKKSKELGIGLQIFKNGVNFVQGKS